MEVFRILDTLRPTATGLDAIAAWFLRLGAPVFAAPIAQLFNQSISNIVVPRQWKTAVITPVPKVSKPVQPSDYRPISTTPFLSHSELRKKFDNIFTNVTDGQTDTGRPQRPRLRIALCGKNIHMFIIQMWFYILHGSVLPKVKISTWGEAELTFWW